MTKNKEVAALSFTDREGEVYTAKLDVDNIGTAFEGDAIIDLSVLDKHGKYFMLAFFKEDAESIINIIREAAK